MNLPPCCRLHLIEMHAEFVDLLNRNNISYCITGGSVLGYIRHHGYMIPYDDDIDYVIDVIHREREFKQKVIPILKILGRDIEEVRWNNLQTHICYSKINKICLDVFWYKVMDNGILYVQDTSGLQYNVSMFFPAEKGTFENVENVSIPRQAMAFVQKRYGKNWNVSSKCTKRNDHNCVE
ncbi:hypothetical protein GJ496_001017 [Pomphorhynchus laevis]|nr:hypothetical protein GJ496_001017 [Pomphorhynchus laevis]